MKKLFLSIFAALALCLGGFNYANAQCSLELEMTTVNPSYYWNNYNFDATFYVYINGSLQGTYRSTGSGDATQTVAVQPGQTVKIVINAYGAGSDYVYYKVKCDGALLVSKQNSNAITSGSTVYEGVPCAAPSCTNGPLATPVVTAIPNSGQVTLSWPAVANADSYSLIWNGGAAETVTSPVVKTGLTNGTSYSYSIKAISNNNAVYCNSSEATGNATPVDPNACSPLVLNLTDAYGDGWNGASLNVSINGGASTAYTISTGTSATYNINISRGDNVVITWTKGSYDYECSYTIIGGDGVNISKTGCADLTTGQEIYSGKPCEPIVVCEILPAPTNLVSTPGNGSLAIGWSAVANAISYEISCNGNTYTSTTNSYTVTGLTNEQEYTYTVKAIGDNNDYCDSPEATATGIPTSCLGTALATPVVAVVPKNNSLTFSWVDVPNVTGYEITCNGSTTTIAPPATTYTLTGLTNGTAYSYTLKAVGDGVSYCSSKTTGYATPACPKIGKPAGFSAAANNESIKLSWAAVTGASGYVITDINNGTTVDLDASQVNYTFTGLMNGMPYRYTIYTKGNGETCNSDPSAEVKATPSDPSSCKLIVNAESTLGECGNPGNWCGTGGFYVTIGSVRTEVPGGTATSITREFEVGNNATVVVEYYRNSTQYVGSGESHTFNVTLDGATIASETFAGIYSNGTITDGKKIMQVYNGKPCQMPAPNCVTSGIEPANSSTNARVSDLKIKWDAVADVDAYDLSWGTTTAMTNTVADIEGLYYTLPTLSPNTKYYWKVVPKNSVGSATGCSTYSFTTGSGELTCLDAYSETALSLSTIKNYLSTTISASEFNGTGIETSCAVDNRYNAGVDKMYLVTPTKDGRMNITMTISTTPCPKTSISVYDACPRDAYSPNCVASVESDGLKVVSLCAYVKKDKPYYVVIDSYEGVASFKWTSLKFKLDAIQTNDESCGSQGIPVSTSIDDATYYKFTTECYSESTTPIAPTCGSFNGSDAWFSVTVPASGNLGLIAKDTTDGIVDGAFAIYTGPACNNLNLYKCYSDGNGTMPKAEVADLGAGNVVYVRFWEEGGDNNGNFYIAAYDPKMPPACDPTSLKASDHLATATPICNFNGYCGNTSDEYTTSNAELESFGNNIFNACKAANAVGWGDITVTSGDANTKCAGSFPEASVDNDSWITFQASETEVSLDLYVSDCKGDRNGHLSGIQIQAYHIDDQNRWTWGYMDFYDPNKATGGYYFANNNVEGVVHDILRLTNLTVGEKYYMVIDGYDLDHCDYKVAAIEGVFFADAGEDQIIEKDSLTSLSASNGLGWSWSASPADPSLVGHEHDQNPPISPSVTTTYTVTITGGNPDCPSQNVDVVTVYVNEVLPVKWLYRKATCENGSMKVEWATASEENCSHFIVEKTLNGVDYVQVAVIPGNGTTTVPKFYSYLDENAGNIAYYRIRQVDNDGKYELSGVFVGKCIQDETPDFYSAYVNGNNIDVTFDAEENATYTISLSDVNGKLLHSEIYKSGANESTVVSFSKTKYAAGVYFVRVSAPKAAKSQKIVLQ